LKKNSKDFYNGLKALTKDDEKIIVIGETDRVYCKS